MLAISLSLDVMVVPRRQSGRQWRGWLLHSLAMAAAFGLVLAITGNSLVAALLATALMALLVIASNAKHAMLGEPLLFSDLALVGWVFRHPRFYLTALSSRQRWALGIGAPAFLLALVASFVPHWPPHLLGIGLLIAALVALATGVHALAAPISVPDVDNDLVRFGLIAMLFLYWARWRATPDPGACPSGGERRPDQPDLVVIVQCESFADPSTLTGDPGLALPGLTRAQADAWQWGNLAVSGFGAYTMRTEYGVLFGRGEAALGFRRFDPFLTALGETSYALPARLQAFGYRALFVHPHDLRFYGRDRLMPAIGFEALIGEEGFVPGESRYIEDNAVGAMLGDLTDKAVRPTLIYAVTMENHGPWIRDRKTGSHGGLDAYLHHLRNSDAMLSGLIDRLAVARRSSVLVFFGDHRPSIPGVTNPGGDRHTPYVILRVSADGQFQTGPGRVDLTPDALHHAVLDCVRSD
jgi:hypothetical protein